jgi:hypothetical protein
MAFHPIDPRLTGKKIGPSRYEIEGYEVWMMRRRKWRATKGDEEITLDSFATIQEAIAERVGRGTQSDSAISE